MPSASDYDLLSGDFLFIEEVKWGGNVIRTRYGAGYVDEAITGPTAGLHRWKLTLKPLPDAALTVGTISGSNWFTWMLEFFKSHTTGGESPFKITWHGKTWTAIFSNPDIEFTRLKDDIYNSGVDIEQVRIRGFTSYASDGSIA